MADDQQVTPGDDETPTEARSEPPAGDEAPTEVRAQAPAGDKAAAAHGQTPWDRSRGRRITVRVLLVLAVVLGVLSVFAVWSSQQLLNTDRWTETSTKLLENKAIRDQVALYLTDELYANVDVQGELQSRLPAEIAPLAGPAAAGLRSVIEDGAGKALENPSVQTVWTDANRVAHEQFVKVIEGGGQDVSTQGGVVTLNLQRVLTQLANRVGVPQALVAKIPPSAANIEILRSDELESAQNAADLLKTLAFILGPLALLTLALAIWLAAGRRRQTLMFAGFAAIITGGIVLAVRSIAGSEISDALADEASVQSAAEAAWNIGSELLRDLGWQAIIIGIVLAIAAWFAGPSRPATAARRAIAPTLREHPEIAYGVVVAVIFLLIVWGPLPAFSRPLFILILIAAALIGVWALRRETMTEFPGGAPPPA